MHVRTKAALVGGISSIAMICALAPMAAYAQVEGAAAVEEIIVTGSRIRNGFQTPTPVTTSTTDDLKAAAPGNLADGLNQLPVFNGSTKTTQATGGGLAGGTLGQNVLNLRGLGGNRALVLLDGRRMVATNETGSVDINVLPQNLVSRVDVVTGGASAAYGSDAVAGVINFVLDTRFQGVKGEIEGGISAHGDSKSFLANIAAGHQFFEGRLRVLASSEFSRQGGVGINDDAHRPWWDDASGQIPNPVSGAKPSVIVVPSLRAALGSYGGLIASGPLKGTQFLQGGQSAPFVYGTPVSGTYMSGGDPNAGNPGNSLSPNQIRNSNFLYGEFDITPDVMLFADGLYSRAHVENDASINFGTGAAAQLNIFRDNAYLPADIRARMIAANVQSIPLGRYYLEFGPVQNESIVTTRRGSVGFKGTVFNNWSWDTSYSRGRSFQKVAKNNLPHLRRYFASSDAVLNPAGQIVCRSTLSGFDPGCVPMNPFGLGAVSKEAADYILGDSFKELKLDQTVLVANISGDLGDTFQLAGPISIATGVEYRKEKAFQTTDRVSQEVVSTVGLRAGTVPTSINGRLGPFQFYNPQPYQGSYNIKEAYVEVGVPLLKDLSFARALDLSLAARRADYSQSGGVTTWKYGFNWELNDQIRARYTKSRDIRGPNVLELFNSQTQTNQTILYQGATTQNVNLTSGNPNLTPERSTTETYGVVVRPGFFPRFQASLDRYDIVIRDSIGNFSAQQTADQCAVGNQAACSQISPQSNGTLIIRLQPLNLSVEKIAGYDFEAAYSSPLLGGNLNLRALISRITDSYRESPGVGRVESLGGPGTPKWRGTLSAQFNQGPFSLYISERFIGKAKIDATRIEGEYTNDNSLPVVAYTNLTAKYKFNALGGREQEAFISISNLLNEEPPVSGGNPTSYNTPANNAYDTMGRYFTVGLRVSLQ